jgi:deoxyribose-phosphate aldolase
MQALSSKMHALSRAESRNGPAAIGRLNLSIDQIMVEERAAAFAKRSIKTSAKLAGLKLAISMMDLTTLEGKDTPGKVAFVCRKAMQPMDPRYNVPPCAAVCVYPNLARPERFMKLREVASVATAFPTGLMLVQLIAEVRSPRGAGKIDMVIDRGQFLRNPDAFEDRCNQGSAAPRI